MSAVGVRTLILAPALLALAACQYPLYHGRDGYAEGMRRLRYEPAAAPEHFEAAVHEFDTALLDEDLDPAERVMAVTMRARCLIELERYSDVAPSLAPPIRGYAPNSSYPGDVIGLSLLKASKLDPERAYAELLLAEKKAATLRSRTYIAWEQVHLLQRIGTPKSKAEAIRLCTANAGKLDFDQIKRTLESP